MDLLSLAVFPLLLDFFAPDDFSYLICCKKCYEIDLIFEEIEEKIYKIFKFYDSNK
jgi:hypothetical protein